jgi:hypothetical protein
MRESSIMTAPRCHQMLWLRHAARPHLGKSDPRSTTA